MPIIKPSEFSAPVFYPAHNYPVVKYLDLTKFISLLQKQKLFFCRLDKLEDQFEGTTTKANYSIRENWVKSDNSVPLTKEEVRLSVEEIYALEKKFKSFKCVNCWNKFSNESAALWKVYSDFGKGIMIKSSILRLEKSLINCGKDLEISEIQYLDYNRDIMVDGNSNYPIIHKHKAYSYEEEVRLIYTVPSESGWIYDWTKEEIEEGVYITVDLNELVDEVVLGPYAPKWIFTIIEDILDKYGLKKQVIKSQLS